uniref:Putative secreted peptide n=1 Tax=Anopheles braziliensis TaxID=58242 RepID=A0A2M3ZQQ0_9DIPT
MTVRVFVRMLCLYSLTDCKLSGCCFGSSIRCVRVPFAVHINFFWLVSEDIRTPCSYRIGGVRCPLPT